MKLLILAQTPPPVHGQSVMVQALVEGLPARGIAVHHIDLRLSHDAADIGRWRWGKIFAVFGACWRALRARFRHGCDTLYYVPAPGKRGALYRDWLVMIFCRPFFKRLVLHWHAAGLDQWLAIKATSLELGLTRLLLGRADLSIVLSESMRADAEALTPRQIIVVPNGIADPCPQGIERATPTTDGPIQVLFLGLCSEEKGLFAAAEAVRAANRQVGTTEAEPGFTLTAAGSFPDFSSGSRYEELCRKNPAMFRYTGQVFGAEKDRLLRTCHCLCLPTRYPAEGQPLVLLEAMAYDLPIIATRWAAIPDTVPPEAILVEPGDGDGLTAALLTLRRSPPPAGALRAHFLAHYTTGQHLSRMTDALTSAG